MRWAYAASCSLSTTSTTSLPACAATVPHSSARSRSTRTSTGSASCVALRASSSDWPSSSAKTFDAGHGTDDYTPRDSHLLDSNVLARATHGKTSAAREVLLLLTQRPHTLITAAPLLGELARILQYPRVRALHGLDDAGIQAYLQAIQV